MVAFIQVLNKLNKKKKFYFPKTIFKTFVCSYKLLFLPFLSGKCLKSDNKINFTVKNCVTLSAISSSNNKCRLYDDRADFANHSGRLVKKRQPVANVPVFSVFISSSSRAYAKSHTNGSLNLSRLKSKSIACASRAVGYDVTCKRFEIYCVFMTRQFCFFYPHTFTGVISTECSTVMTVIYRRRTGISETFRFFNRTSIKSDLFSKKVASHKTWVVFIAKNEQCQRCRCLSFQFPFRVTRIMHTLRFYTDI